ncbi:uncharacterized protein LOC117767990 [Hippoglossus hippoglossus]|uniref:uncharacterized protein LOC117767990 n=1 Tax=Hippoglossus hippoglossus TaxID=8267 RepID=UPI00148C8B99|nr:uncharacterized protein LOC117767990 [Hippoglossus hippoglossus]
MQVKLQSIIQQVREQIKSQGGTRAPKSSILELVQRVKDREVEGAQMDSEPEGGDVNSEDNRHSEMNRKEQELCAMFEQKLEASKKAWRDEYEQQISQVCREMQAYTDKALKDMECKLQSWQSHAVPQTHPREQQESKGPDRKQKPPAAAPSLAARRGRVLTRTMTTIIPKTCTPVIMGPRAKSETLTYSRGARSRILPRDLTLSSPGNKPHQSHRPLPPTQPQPHHQCRKSVWGKTKAGKQNKEILLIHATDLQPRPSH